MTENVNKSQNFETNIRDLPKIKSLTITDRIFQFIIKEWFSNKRKKISRWLSNINEFNFKFGTKEWADENFNTHYACKNACWYCYAWNEAYQRQRDYYKDWGNRMTLRKYWNKGWQKREDGYTIMYPTTHDIVPETINESFQAIQKMLKANINVLFVSKPHFEVIKELINTFSDYKTGQPKIILRFTISTNDDKALSFWEPNAPKFEERLKSLKYAYQYGFYTSISMEPFFPAKNSSNKTDIDNFILLVKKLLNFIKGTLWIGKMNHIPVNVQRGIPLSKFEKQKINYLRKFYGIDNIKNLVYQLYNLEKIRWKESIKKDIINLIIDSK